PPHANRLMTRPRDQVTDVMELHRSGLNAVSISRVTSVPRSTVQEWIRPGYARQPKRRECFRCDRSQYGKELAYVYLLSLYLGDGCISRSRRVWRLRIFQDARYTGLIAECIRAVSSVAPSRVSTVQRAGCVEIGASWMHWLHLFPQHGPRTEAQENH